MDMPVSWPQLVVIGVGLAVPFLTHLVTTLKFLAHWRRGITFGLTAIGAVVVQVAYAPGESWKAYAGAIFYAWAAMVISHFSGGPDVVNEATPNFGIGPKTYETHAGVKVTESDGPPPPPKSPGLATEARQSRMRNPRSV